MKNILFLVLVAYSVLLTSCGQKSNEHEHGHHKDSEQSANQGLYDEVMKVHDEVMPKMDDIYKLKEQLKKQLEATPALVDEKKTELQHTILELDSASEGMMVWMRNFNPIPDSLGEEKARQYLEEQKVKVNKVKEDMLQAIEEAKAKAKE
jgi:hypothetical protein